MHHASASVTSSHTCCVVYSPNMCARVAGVAVHNRQTKNLFAKLCNIICSSRSLTHSLSLSPHLPFVRCHWFRQPTKLVHEFVRSADWVCHAAAESKWYLDALNAVGVVCFI